MLFNTLLTAIQAIPICNLLSETFKENVTIFLEHKKVILVTFMGDIHLSAFTSYNRHHVYQLNTSKTFGILKFTYQTCMNYAFKKYLFM